MQNYDLKKFIFYSEHAKMRVEKQQKYKYNVDQITKSKMMTFSSKEKYKLLLFTRLLLQAVSIFHLQRNFAYNVVCS